MLTRLYDVFVNEYVLDDHEDVNDNDDDKVLEERRARVGTRESITSCTTHTSLLQIAAAAAASDFLKQNFSL